MIFEEIEQFLVKVAGQIISTQRNTDLKHDANYIDTVIRYLWVKNHDRPRLPYWAFINNNGCNYDRLLWTINKGQNKRSP